MLRAKWEDRGSLALSLVHKAVLLLQQAPNNTLWEKEHFPCTSEKVSNIWASVSFWFFFCLFVFKKELNQMIPYILFSSTILCDLRHQRDPLG